MIELRFFKGTHRERFCVALCLSMLAACEWAVPFAQAQVSNSPAPVDPLMSLLLSQPRLDLSTPVTANASFDPPVVRPGERAIYRITLNALEQSVALPKAIVAEPKLEMEPRAHGQILQQAGNKQIPLSAFNFRVRPAAEGEFVVREFVLHVYGKPVKIPEARLKVAHAPEATIPAQQLILELDETNLYVGQPVRAQVRFPGTAIGGVQGLAQVQFNGEGFMNDSSAVHQSIRVLPYGQASVATYIYETTLTPISTKVGLFAQGFAAGNRFSGPIVITGQVSFPVSAPQYTLLESDSVELTARPLPSEGELPGFTGAIGSFTLDVPQLSTNVVRVGEAVRLSVTVRSRSAVPANLNRLVPPSPPRSEQWQVLEATPSGLPPQIIQAAGFVSFQYTLIPLTEQATETPAIPFSFFEPARKAYADLTIPAVPIQVNPGTIAADLKSLLQPSTQPGGEPELTLSGLTMSEGKRVRSLTPAQQQPWFPLVQVSPALAFIALCGWDRRRRYLQQHPDILLRRRARRALRRQRREMRRASRAGDAIRFAGAAVGAMQVACAPHYPAEPRALVGTDVLPLLDDARADQKDIVRRVFASSDASHFSGRTGDAAGLLGLELQLEGVLELLEAKL